MKGKVKFKSTASLSQKIKPDPHSGGKPKKETGDHAFKCLVSSLTRHHSPINAAGNWAVLGEKLGQAPAEVWEEGLKLPLHHHSVNKHLMRACKDPIVLGAGDVALNQTDEFPLLWN